MELIKEKVEEGLRYAKQTIASMEEVNFDDLADDAAFREQYAEAMMVVVKMLAILAEAKLTNNQRTTLQLLIQRHNRCVDDLKRDVFARWSEQASAPVSLN